MKLHNYGRVAGKNYRYSFEDKKDNHTKLHVFEYKFENDYGSGSMSFQCGDASFIENMLIKNFEVVPYCNNCDRKLRRYIENRHRKAKQHLESRVRSIKYKLNGLEEETAFLEVISEIMTSTLKEKALKRLEGYKTKENDG